MSLRSLITNLKGGDTLSNVNKVNPWRNMTPIQEQLHPKYNPSKVARNSVAIMTPILPDLVANKKLPTKIQNYAEGDRLISSKFDFLPPLFKGALQLGETMAKGTLFGDPKNQRMANDAFNVLLKGGDVTPEQQAALNKAREMNALNFMGLTAGIGDVSKVKLQMPGGAKVGGKKTNIPDNQSGRTPQQFVQNQKTEEFYQKSKQVGNQQPNQSKVGGVGVKGQKVSQGVEKLKATEQLPQKLGKQNLSQSELKPELPSVDSSLSYFNTKNLKVSKKTKTFISKTVEEVKPQIEKTVGKKLTNKEAVEIANNSANVLDRAVTRNETLAWEAKMLRARQLVAQQAKEGTITQAYLDNMVAIKSQGSDIARKLQSMSILADPKEITAKQAILDAVLKVTDDTDAILAKAKGVDFNNFEQSSAFYRQFIKPTASDWLDKIRYSSMLSSPNTHINNFSSNFQGTGIIAPIEKTIAGALDKVASTVNPNRPREQYTGEGVAYVKGYYSKLKEASKNFGDTLSGKKFSTTQEMRNIPLSKDGTLARTTENILSVPGRFLQAADEFFQTLTSGGVKSQLEYRESRGIKVTDIENKAYLEGRKRLFNAEFGLDEEGPVLKAIEFLPMKVSEARASANPVISTVAKYSFPFVRVPSNILKASVEYGPLGVSTIPGSATKLQQLSKALLGTSIGVGVATLVGRDNLTFGEPTSEKQKNAFRAAGMQPYSVKIGNKWYSYSKMHPAISFNFALVAALRDAEKNKKLSDDEVETVLNGLAKWVNFYADMSYVKNVGDAVSGIKGDLDAGTKQISNYAQQFIPFRALMGWVARIVDPYQRQVDKDGSILDKQLQQLMTQIPGLSTTVPARVDSKGNPIDNQNRLLNAFSPVRVTTENSAGVKAFKTLETKTINTRRETEIKQGVLDSKKEATFNGKLFYPVQELNKETGETETVVKTLKVSEPTPSEVYAGLPKKYETSEDAPSNIFSKIALYGTGIFKDTDGTINAIRTGQPVRKMNGDAIVVERLSSLASMDSGDKATQVDHIVANALGGDNSEANLQVISVQDNQAKAVVDTYLLSLLESGKIKHKEAQERDKNWRNEINTLPTNLKAKAQAILASKPAQAPVVKNPTTDNLSGKYIITNKSTGTKTVIDLSDVPELPKISGYTELDKELLSKYNSKITTRINNIEKIYLDGQITADEANTAITALKALKKSISKKSGSGKAKKVNLAAISQKILKPVSVQTKTPKFNTFEVLAGFNKVKAPNIEAPSLEVPKFDLPKFVMPNFKKGKA